MSQAWSNDETMNCEGRTKQVVKGGVCVTHGSKTQCIFEGYANIVVKGGVCVTHGAKTKLRQDEALQPQRMYKQSREGRSLCHHTRRKS